ncbi:uncharacterized protein F5891DRAFT_132276 [Suillus fuscotomentosus]|uniref:Uncharacterized protein n=1 Tax=Suillus fuscotomentosus TaxID=1912939 RepID=A0AAD4HND9_9AGAM|nr:uncharacterized protein F5891DRAFT_132276 [Suillus fuscotomentosus]KAG1902877.1 hypothetical protein F5891DRAFT_132276 [Suillus fuscotomentosus]
MLDNKIIGYGHKRKIFNVRVYNTLAFLSQPPIMMAASSRPTEENPHPSSLLAYNALPGHQDFDPTIADAKPIADTVTEFYDRSLTSRKYALVGMACTSIFSCLCIITGIVTVASHGIMGVAPLSIPVTVVLKPDGPILNNFGFPQSPLQAELLTLMLDLIVTLCTESTGFVHGIALRSALASESRLRFNTNLRLLTAARGWHNPNGALLNGISAVLLIISYSSSSLIVCVDQRVPYEFTDGSIIQGSGSVAIAGIPLLILGVALLLQVIIALSAMRAVKILTWSSSPFDLTAALVHHTHLTPATFRCMRRVSDLDTYGGPAKPPETQPSPWHAHPSIRKVVIFLWVIVAAYAGWAALVMYIWNHPSVNMLIMVIPLTLQTWSFFPTWDSNFIMYFMLGVNLKRWILLFLDISVVQGSLTLGLHCSELIINVIRDERQWRSATTRQGLRVATNPLKPIFTHPLCLILFIVKPFLHWMFGLSFNIDSLVIDETLEDFAISMYTAQIWNLCIALFILACFFTLISLLRPHGPQPAAYGHLQTLANLVDEWSPVMWWGHKEDGIPYCHAGTSDHPLPDVKMDCVYAGSGPGSLVPLS